MPFSLSCLPRPLRVLRKLPELDEILRGHCFSGKLAEAVEILCFRGSRVDPQTYAFLLQECINRKDVFRGRRIHAQMITVGFSPDQYLMNKLIILYAKHGDMGTSSYLFDKIRDRNLISWNAMISGYVQKCLDQEGLSLYYQMRGLGLEPDQFTFASVFRACASLATLEQGKRAHAVMIKVQTRTNVVVNSALVDMYFKCSCPLDGRLVFDKSLEKNVITWTALISGYGHHGRVQEVLSVFQQMLEEGCRPNYVTFVAVLSACSYGGLIDEGKRYFSCMTREYNIRPGVEHVAAMVDLLGRAGRLDEAYEFVKRSPSCGHSQIWGALLGACGVHGNVELLKITAKRFFNLDIENAGKYVVLSNAYASFGLWENASDVRETMKGLGMKKEPGCSWIEVQSKVHSFCVGDNSHERIKQIYDIIKELDPMMKDSGYVPEQLIQW
ncbi:pentatricopeptide repeat-containing protein At4g16470 [Aristolochia californica]|uniref:pentatricopeptide repeat-containing protein At4g16470 n=1 Tax=Aristolochia californica TaxID=171875 RepID=UPI0035DCBF4C